LVAPLPDAPAGSAIGVGGANLAAMENREDKEAAWTFIDWMISPEVNLRWSTGTGYLPLRRAVILSEVHQQYLEDEPRARVILDQINVARARPNIPQYAGASRDIGLAVEEALLTGADPVTVLAAAADKKDCMKASSPLHLKSKRHKSTAKQNLWRPSDRNKR
jgi:ABC-type glycerol-3-phosphate transport system substrate-binding protein